VLSEKWVKKRVAKILVPSNNPADISVLIFLRFIKIITTGEILPVC